MPTTTFYHQTKTTLKFVYNLVRIYGGIILILARSTINCYYSLLDKMQIKYTLHKIKILYPLFWPSDTDKMQENLKTWCKALYVKCESQITGVCEELKDGGRPKPWEGLGSLLFYYVLNHGGWTHGQKRGYITAQIINTTHH